MSSYYAKLVDQLGEAGARQHMRELRSRVKHPGFAGQPERARQAQIKSVQARLEKKREKNSSDTEDTA